MFNNVKGQAIAECFDDPMHENNLTQMLECIIDKSSRSFVAGQLIWSDHRPTR